MHWKIWKQINQPSKNKVWLSLFFSVISCAPLCKILQKYWCWWGFCLKIKFDKVIFGANDVFNVAMPYIYLAPLIGYFQLNVMNKHKLMLMYIAWNNEQHKSVICCYVNVLLYKSRREREKKKWKIWVKWSASPETTVFVQK